MVCLPIKKEKGGYRRCFGCEHKLKRIDEANKALEAAEKRIGELEGATLRMEFGQGKILVSPMQNGDGSVSIGFSTRLGQGDIGEEHPTIQKGDSVTEQDYDVILNFANAKPLQVIKWAIDEAETALKGSE